MNYLLQNLTKDRENFLESAKSTYNALSVVFSDGRIFSNYDFFHILNRITSDTLIETLKYIRQNYRNIDKAKDTNKKEPIYLFRILINRGIRVMATPKNGDKESWENWKPWIDIISSDKTFITLTSVIPNTTLVNCAKEMLKSYIKEKLKELEESSEIKFVNLEHKEEISEEDINEVIENCKYESHIISPWGEEIK
ncbi:hypothetical protein AFK68_26570 [Hydrocoleum sp. CS-953]|nr:hypothetical protein AFK68_26570 [Hydrocoleum sp. CS-953]